MSEFNLQYEFNCQHCKRSFEVHEDKLGQVIECPNCKKQVSLPNSEDKGMSKARAHAINRAINIEINRIHEVEKAKEHQKQKIAGMDHERRLEEQQRNERLRISRNHGF